MFYDIDYNPSSLKKNVVHNLKILLFNEHLQYMNVYKIMFGCI